MFTFRGIPRVFYGSEIEFQAGSTIYVGPNAPLSTTGHAYYGDYLAGTIDATDFGKYTASGTAATTLDSNLSKHIRQLNEIRRKVPALRKGQYSIDSNFVSGDMAFIRRYTDGLVDSLALVAISGNATFKNIPNGKYVNAADGTTVNVTDGTLSVALSEKGAYAVYVCCADGFTPLDAELEVSAGYSLSFEANGGSGTMENVSSVNGYVVLPECTFTPPTEKAFKAWSIGDKEYDAGDYVKLTSNTTAKPIWRYAGDHNVSFEANGGSGTMNTLSAPDGAYILPECDFTAPFGKSFKAWRVNEDEVAAGRTITLSNDTTLYAVWQDISITLTSRNITAVNLPKNAKLILSSYSDKGLVDMRIFDVSGSFSKTMEETGLITTDAKKAKVFLWDNMQSITPLYGIVETSLEKANVIVYENTNGWTNVNAYIWNSSGAHNSTWPGVAMSNISGTNLWYIVPPADGEMIIFNNGSSQTADITIPTDGSNMYSNGTWTTYNGTIGEDTGGDTGGSADIITGNNIYFDNTNSAWSTVYAYMWDDSGDPVSWPGVAMTSISGTNLWYIEAPSTQMNIIFNSGIGNQTADLTIPSDGKNLYTYNTGWSTYGG